MDGRQLEVHCGCGRRGSCSSTATRTDSSLSASRVGRPSSTCAISARITRPAATSNLERVTTRQRSRPRPANWRVRDCGGRCEDPSEQISVRTARRLSGPTRHDPPGLRTAGREPWALARHPVGQISARVDGGAMISGAHPRSGRPTRVTTRQVVVPAGREQPRASCGADAPVDRSLLHRATMRHG